MQVVEREGGMEREGMGIGMDIGIGIGLDMGMSLRMGVCIGICTSAVRPFAACGGQG